MKKRMKCVAAILLAGVMTFGMTACGPAEADTTGTSTGQGNKETQNTEDTGNEPEVSNAESDGGEDVTIKITWWGGQSRHDYTQQLLDLYTEEHPNVTFEAVPAGWDGYFDKLSTQAASGSMPDIIQMDYLYISTYAKNESIVDLQEFIDDGTIDVSNIDVNMLNAGNVNGKLAGLVLSSSILSVGYNPEVIEAAGADIPELGWSWEDYIAMNRKVAESTGQPSALVSSGVTGDTNLFNYWVREHGASLFNETGTGLGYDDDQICADFFQMWKDMIDENVAADPDEQAQITTLGQEAGPVVTGTAATTIDWNNYANRMASVNDKLRITAIPISSDASAKGLWLKPGMFFSIAETSTVKKEAAEFIDWFINSEEANDIIMGERGTPVSSVIRSYLIDSGKLTQQQIDMFQYVDDVADYCGETPAPDPTGISEVNAAFDNAGNSVFYGMSTAEEAAAAFREEATEILERNNK